MAKDTAWWRDDPGAQRQGFGMILHLKEGRWVVARTLVGSPADSAGIRVGYALHSIAGNEIAHSLRHTKLKGTSNNDDFVVGSPAAVA